MRIVVTWCKGLVHREDRDDPDYILGWGIILGSIPVGVVGLVFKDAIENTLSSLWVVAIALILWSGVMWLGDRQSGLNRGMKEVGIVDAIVIGCFQALAPLFPGISRSGATISAGLFRKFDRATATRLSFFMGIPVLVAAGIYETVSAAGDISIARGGAAAIGWGPTILATVVSLVVAYVSIAWLLKFVSSNKFTGFIWYRVIVGLVMIGLILTNVVTA